MSPETRALRNSDTEDNRDIAMLNDAEHQLVTAPLPSTHTLPPSAYTSVEVFDAESRRIFQREWVSVAHEDQIPNAGDYKSVDVVGRPLIVVRLKDQSIHAMSAVCTHRAMPVADACGNTSTFLCPYHL
ncbi:MAG: Rieske 2Fe-2S domain-containing protein [Pseudomonadales bacterium]|jgi:phenylpropionate dioxygenase-like ring-hydroxylating dioxygenase large terminal subunit|nr:Rieske 2Fe-2S domain-containing protein [Pseudomonadales bacterium]MDP6470139.1 Rieske 2Fe-2S domain-containing protein [Pseudomonadales bacterium]MDP6827045.1 Rieske 2Fe-2S domain-containing protein [Pseudomonadales bacterium]